MSSPVRTLTLALALALTATAASATASETREHCFPTNSWKSWSAAENGDVIYLRVNINDIYRVELTPGANVHKEPGRFLVNHVRGSNWICSALDLDLSLADDLGFHRALIARSMRMLTPAEVAAVPRKDLP